MSLRPAAVGILIAAPACAAMAAEYQPVTDPLPQAVQMMKPTSVLRRDLLIRDGCYYYYNLSRDIVPFDFASPNRGIPYCEDGATPPSDTD